MWFWKVVLISLFIPLSLLYHLSKLVVGREMAQNFFYQRLVTVSARLLSIAIPSLNANEDFSIFSSNLKKALSRMPFEEIRVAIDEPDRIQLNITRCQFTEVFRLLGMSGLTKALCDGDILFCQQYQASVEFERHRSIEKGNSYCDHTFRSARESARENES